MLEDQDPMDQEYLDGFGMHHFGIGPTDAEDKNLRDEESSEFEKTEKYVQSIAEIPMNNELTLFSSSDQLLRGLINSMINSGDETLMNRGYMALGKSHFVS